MHARAHAHTQTQLESIGAKHSNTVQLLRREASESIKKLTDQHHQDMISLRTKFEAKELALTDSLKVEKASFVALTAKMKAQEMEFKAKESVLKQSLKAEKASRLALVADMKSQEVEMDARATSLQPNTLPY